MEIDVKTLIDRIELHIAKMGMSKEMFYKDSGISSASFSQWNTGIHKPTLKKVTAAAKTLGVSVEYLLGNADTVDGVVFSDGTGYGGGFGSGSGFGDGSGYGVPIPEFDQKEKSPTPEGVGRIPGYEDLNEENKIKAKDFIAFLLSQQ